MYYYGKIPTDIELGLLILGIHIVLFGCKFYYSDWILITILSNKIDGNLNNVKHIYNWNYMFPYLLQNKYGQERIIYVTNLAG